MDLAGHLPRTAEGAVALGGALFALIGWVALGLSPARDRFVVGGVVLALAVALLAAVTVWLHLRQRAEEPHGRPLPTEGVDETWFTPETLRGFPAQTIDPMTHRPDAPGRNSLYTAWICATHGCDAGWIVHHLGLSEEVARTLVDAAARQREKCHAEEQRRQE
ncbi:hypothetical protein [Streptomyces noursei]|uniref:hypothetical protein n=1 Tax=Streptomyces noursei TaxID=1971 RepID=UPI00069F2B54|nr:hypothetical protein [Streptomyces noursei]